MKTCKMTTMSEGLPSEFIDSELCPDIPSLSGNLNSAIDTDALQVVEHLDETIKHAAEEVPVMQVEKVNLVGESIEEKRLPSVYITLPVGSVVKYSMNYVCRLCAAVIDADSVVNIFSALQFQDNLAWKINKYLPILVYDTDPFPKTVCKSCVTKLNEFHDMVEKCVAVEEQLRQAYVFDGSYLDELNKKLSQKSESDMLKSEPEQFYTMTELQYMDSLDVDQLNSNSKEVERDEEVSKNESHEVVEEKREKDQIRCRFCQNNLSNLKESIAHWESHYGDASRKEWTCLVCERVTSSKIDLENHFRIHFKGEGKIVNSRDKTKARQQRLLKNKLKICSKLVCCRKCKQTLDGVETAVEHCLKHKPPNVKFYPCVICVNGIGKSKLKEHISMHYPMMTKPILTCDNCNNLYPDEKTLKYHRCTKLRKYKCSQCKQGFKSEDRLKFHEDFHRNKSTFCEICKKDFKFESRMYLHFAGVHNGIREKPYCCDVCGKTFTWLTLLNSHKRTHTNERPFKCTKCDARFCNKYSLNGHMPSHDDHPQMYCDKCDYHTGRKQNLLNHVSRFHKEITSSQTCIRCRICFEIFPNRHHVEVEGHQNRHSEDCSAPDLFHELLLTKLYQCERCERCFASVDDLTQHRTTHPALDSNSLYQCRLCDLGFSKHDLLVKHQKVHVRVTSQYSDKLSVLIVISCDICGMECVDYRQFMNHKDRANCMMKKITGTLRPRKVLIKKHLQPLKTHQLFVNSNGLFECPSCQRTYKNRRRYRLHLATHSNSV